MLFILPYTLGSESARELAHGLNVKRISGKKRLPTNSVVINWGNSEVTPITNSYSPAKIINKPEAVRLAANKLETFKAFTRHNIPTVEYTTSRDVALSWIQDGAIVMCRKYINSSQGNGIIVSTAEDDYLPTVPLYTKMIARAHEFRVHVAFGNVIDFSKKKRRDGQACNDYVKNFNNGWVFCRDNVILPEIVKQASIKAVAALGLDFGALDVIYKESEDKVAVLEINTAPGIEGTTLTKYTDLFKEKFNVNKTTFTIRLR